MRRLPAIVALVAALLAGGAADRAGRPAQARNRVSLGALQPAAAPAGALSSAWYCPIGSGVRTNPANASLTLLNPSPRALGTHVTVLSDSAPPRTVAVTVPARDQAVVALADVLPAAVAGAEVEVDGGQLAVEHVISGPGGTNVGACLSSASDRWYLADGSTAKDATLWLALENPFPEDAIVDLSFLTDQGPASPADFQGIVVPPRSTVLRDIGEHVRRREQVATQVDVRSGRVVAEQLQQRASAGKPSLSLTAATPSPAATWWFPEGYTAPGLNERLTVLNPSGRETRVDIAVALDQGTAEPFELTVPAHATAVLDAGAEARLPPGVGHAFTVRALDGAAVVVQRTFEAAPPFERTGRSDAMGSRLAARHWALAYGAANARLDETVTVLNPGATAAHVSLAAVGGGALLFLDKMQGVLVAPGARVALHLNEVITRDVLPVRIDADRPVVVERTVGVLGAPGLSSAIGIVLG